MLKGSYFVMHDHTDVSGSARGTCKQIDLSLLLHTCFVYSKPKGYGKYAITHLRILAGALVAL